MRLFQNNATLLLTAGILIAVTAACSGGSTGSSTPAPTAQETDPPAIQTAEISVDSQEGKAVVSYEDENGEKAEYQVGLEGNVEIPDDYPEDVVPVYPDSLVTVAGYEDDSFMIVASTDDDFEDIFNYYKDHIDFSETELLQNMEGFVLLSGTAGGYHANVTVTENVSE